ncbi:hypothetical protein GVX82_04255 [Patescibacteria group bacterium]|jgi:hypothetical protein|nr:hypothetical protein [Patescibacteria group bacterium]
MILEGIILIALLSLREHIKPWHAALIYLLILGPLSFIGVEPAEAVMGMLLAGVFVWGYFSVLRFLGSGVLYYIGAFVGFVALVLFV